MVDDNLGWLVPTALEVEINNYYYYFVIKTAPENHRKLFLRTKTL